MFTKNSRYYSLPEVIALDAKGRELQSKDFRLLPQVNSTLAHPLTALDRWDSLAHEYYKEVRNWWSIADANPEFLSPWALLGKEPVITQRFELAWSQQKSQSWSQLYQQLVAVVGVKTVRIIDTWLGEQAVIVTFNSLNTDTETLQNIITAAKFVVTGVVTINRIGKPLLIPPIGNR